MLEKLKDAEARYCELEELLASADVFSNQERFTSIMKEYKSLTPVIEKYREYKSVQSETEDKRADRPPQETWRIRKEESLEKLKNTDDESVLMLWIGDKLSNIRAIYRDYCVEGDKVWDKFHQSDIKVQAWYYRSIMKYTARLSDTLAWIEYKTLVEKIVGVEE